MAVRHDRLGGWSKQRVGRDHQYEENRKDDGRNEPVLELLHDASRDGGKFFVSTTSCWTASMQCCLSSFARCAIWDSSRKAAWWELAIVNRVLPLVAHVAFFESRPNELHQLRRPGLCYQDEESLPATGGNGVTALHLPPVAAPIPANRSAHSGASCPARDQPVIEAVSTCDGRH